jgi:Glyoxalase-like domain
MHRRRLFGLFMDTPRAAAPEAVTFWSAALGATPYVEDESYTRLTGAHDGLALEVQAIDDGEPRYHLDIETDDVEAEAARLIALGATVVARPPGWYVLRAPSGHILCVVAVQSERAYFEANSTVIA